MKRWRCRTVSDWNISFIKQYWRCFHSGEVSVNQENWTAGIPLKRRTAGALFPIITTWSHNFDQYLYLKYSYTHICKWVVFFKVTWPHRDDVTSSWEECHLDFSPKSCTYSTLATIDPPEVKIISILPYKIVTVQLYSAPLPLTIVYFLLLLRKKMFCVSLFSVKELLIYKFKWLSFLRRLYNMSCTICTICLAQLSS